MENACSTSRPEAFPAGLRVLVVDDDPTWLKILEKMLRRCSYEVTTCSLARVALHMLRERKDKFDIVISDVNMPDMDGFKLLEQVGLEMDLPVIMMSVDGETSRVMKGVQHGACDYLLKPVQMKEIRNIWQHVFRKKIHDVQEIENHESTEDDHMKYRLEEFDEKCIVSRGDIHSIRKRKDVDDKEHIEQNSNDTASGKKPRVVWSVDLHKTFVNAVNQIGINKVGPKKILDLMNVPGLTRENVASHLQKYRLYLSRLQKQNEGRTSDESEQVVSSKDHSGISGLSIVMENNSSLNNYGLFSTGTQLQDMILKAYRDDLIHIGSSPAIETMLALNSQNNESQKMDNVPTFGVRISSEERVPGLGYRQNDICISKNQQSDCGENQVMQFMKEDQEFITFVKDYSQLPQAGKYHHFQDDYLHNQFPIQSIASSMGKNKSPSSHMKPVGRYENNHAKNMTLECSIDLVSPQIVLDVKNTHNIEVTSSSNGTSRPKSYSNDDKNIISSWESTPQKLELKAEVNLSNTNDMFQCSLQRNGYCENIELNSFETFEYSNQIDIQSIWYDKLQYNCEYLFDSLEIPMIDDCLFT